MRSLIKSSKTLLILTAFFAVSFAFAGSAYSQSVPTVTVKANKKSFNGGETGTLTISFKPAKNVKIPKEPEITVTSINGVEGAGMQDYSAGGGDYLSSNKVKYNFTVPSGLASGTTVKISGTVKFGYCNSDDGVCKIAKKDFSTTIKIK
ncbi:MAG TPA: hypothetical protein VHP32_05790 [Ignavibacteria bacterium]|nr:hypothetical protein [Ignavibacteria bacterium]